MKYIANPVEVDAFVITGIEGNPEIEAMKLTLDDGRTVEAGPDLTARYIPIVGDYWVAQQSDGYIYLNPKEVFEREYRPAV